MRLLIIGLIAALVIACEPAPQRSTTVIKCTQYGVVVMDTTFRGDSYVDGNNVYVSWNGRSRSNIILPETAVCSVTEYIEYIESQ